jgi:hypothetical protein
MLPLPEGFSVMAPPLVVWTVFQMLLILAGTPAVILIDQLVIAAPLFVILM